MRFVSFIIITLLGIHPVFGEEPTIESLVKRIEALEQKVATLTAQISTSRHEEQKEVDPDSRALGEVVVDVLEDDRIRVEGRVMDDDAFSGVLKSISAEFRDQAVILRGDKETKYQDIIRVLNLCQNAGIWNIAFAAASPRAEQDGADQPATAPELKTEGKEKPKPESKARSQ